MSMMIFDSPSQSIMYIWTDACGYSDILASWCLAVLCQVKQRLFIEASSVAVANEVAGLFGPAVQVGYENHEDATWMIVPLGKWLITTVSKSLT